MEAIFKKQLAELIKKKTTSPIQTLNNLMEMENLDVQEQYLFSDNESPRTKKKSSKKKIRETIKHDHNQDKTFSNKYFIPVE